MKRQKLLFLYLSNSTPDSKTIGWSLYDGTGKEKPPAEIETEPPYESALDAMKDGWLVIQLPTLSVDVPGQEYHTNYLEFEFILEQIEDCDD